MTQLAHRPASADWAVGVEDAVVLAELRELCAQDHSYSDGTVFNSICSEPLPLSAAVFASNLDANVGDNRIFPSLPRCGELVVSMLAQLMTEPAAGGLPTSGATEANLLAVLIALRQHRGPGLARVVLGRNAHFSFDKIISLLPVEPHWIDVDEGYRVQSQQVLAAARTRPALVVLTAGSSECGAVDDIEELAPACARLGVRVHVDAATGGFLVPFAVELGHPVSACDFSVPGVSSIALDPHKYGGAPIPSGALLVREPADLDLLTTASHYQGTADHRGLLGTRPGAAVLATYAALRSMGRAGYRQAAHDVFRRRELLLELMADAGLRPSFEPQLMVVPIAHPNPEQALLELQRRGLIVSVSRRIGFIRIVVHRHQSDDQLRRLISEIANVS